MTASIMDAVNANDGRRQSSPLHRLAARRSAVRYIAHREQPMIPRYSRPEMAAIFAPETRLGIWLDVELAAAEAMAAIGVIPAEPVRVLVANVAARRDRLIDPAGSRRSRPRPGTTSSRS